MAVVSLLPLLVVLLTVALAVAARLGVGPARLLPPLLFEVVVLALIAAAAFALRLDATRPVLPPSQPAPLPQSAPAPVAPTAGPLAV